MAHSSLKQNGTGLKRNLSKLKNVTGLKAAKLLQAITFYMVTVSSLVEDYLKCWCKKFAFSEFLLQDEQ